MKNFRCDLREWCKKKVGLIETEASVLKDLESLINSKPRFEIQGGFVVNLDIRRNNLNEIPEFIGNLKNLLQLNLGSNNLEILPESIGNLTNLKIIRYYKS